MNYLDVTEKIIIEFLIKNKQHISFNMLYYFLFDMELMSIKSFINPNEHRSYYSYLCDSDDGFQSNHDLLLDFESNLLKSNNIPHDFILPYDYNDLNRYVLMPYVSNNVISLNEEYTLTGQFGILKKINDIKILNKRKLVNLKTNTTINAVDFNKLHSLDLLGSLKICDVIN